MALTKEELNKIAIDYHGKDDIQDKFIEDECQYFTYEWVFSLIQVHDRVLELGYGEGNFTEELVKRGFHPAVIDGSNILLEKAKSLYGDKIETIHSLFEEFDAEDKFDCVLATHVLEHVDNPVAVLQSMKKWIKSTGKIIIIVPNKESLHRQLAVIMGLQKTLDSLGTRDKLVGHQRVYSINTLSQDVYEAGLIVSDANGFFLKTLPNSMMIQFSRELIIALNKISPKLPKELLANIGMVVTK